MAFVARDTGTSAARRRRGAPAPLVAATRADDRAHGVGRSPAPFFVPRCRARDVRRFTEPDDGQLQGGVSVFFDLYDEDTEGGSA